jgi:hypothetical protein
LKPKFVFLVSLMGCLLLARATSAQSSAGTPNPGVDEWTTTFEGNSLDTTKWERFTFEGGSGGTFKVEKGQLKLRGVNGARSGVRSKQRFSSDRFIVEGTVAKIGPAMPDPETGGLSPGRAILTVLFDDSGRNRVEWILTSEGTMEAWAIVNGQSERVDNRKLSTKTPNPVLGIVRRGDQFLFMLNGQIGLQTTVKNLPRDFWVMLYGYGSSENNWSAVRVATMKGANP